MEKNITVLINARSQECRDAFQRMVPDIAGFQVISPGVNVRPDLLIYELGHRPDDDFKRIQGLFEANAVSEVFVTAEGKDADLLLKAMRAGAKEFIAQPLDEAEVRAALQAAGKRFAQAAGEKKTPVHMGRIIHVLGAKGGVGSTTVAVNLAMLLSERKNAGSVSLVDLNMIFGEIPLFLSLTPTYHWGQIIKNIHRLDPTFLMNAMPRHSSGVYLMPSPNTLNGHPPASPDIMERLMATLQNTFDYIIVDGGQSLNPSALKVIEMAERILIVTLLNLPCLHNTNKLMHSLEGANGALIHRVNLILNRLLNKSDISLKEAQDNLGHPFFWDIPNDFKTTMSAINRGKPLHEIAPKAGITRKIDGLADAIIHGAVPMEQKRKWFLKK